MRRPSSENYQGGVRQRQARNPETNKYHGGAYEFFRNDRLMRTRPPRVDARHRQRILGFDAQGVQKKPELRYNHFGGLLAGRLLRTSCFLCRLSRAAFDQCRSDRAQVLTTSASQWDFLPTLPNIFTGGICQDTALDSQGNPYYVHQMVVPNTGAGTVLCESGPESQSRRQPTPLQVI